MNGDDDQHILDLLPHQDHTPVMHQEGMTTIADIVALVIKTAAQIVSEESNNMYSNQAEDWNSQLIPVKTPERNKILRDRGNGPPVTNLSNVDDPEDWTNDDPPVTILSNVDDPEDWTNDDPPVMILSNVDDPEDWTDDDPPVTNLSNVDDPEDWTDDLMTIPTPKAYKDRVAAINIKLAPPKMMIPRQIIQTQSVACPVELTLGRDNDSQHKMVSAMTETESTGILPMPGSQEKSTHRGLCNKRPFFGQKERGRTSTIHRKILTDLGIHTKHGDEEKYFQRSPEIQKSTSLHPSLSLDMHDQPILTSDQDADERTPAKMLYIPPHARSKSLDGADVSPFKIPMFPSTPPIKNLKVESASSECTKMWSTPSVSDIASWKASSVGREHHFSRRRQDRLPNLPPRLRRAYASHYQISPDTKLSCSKGIRPDWKIRFKGRCRNYTSKYVDTHCHLDFLFNREKFCGSFHDFMECHEDTFPESFEACIAVFCDPCTFLSDGGLWRELCSEPNVWLTMGCHPKSATDFTSYAEEEMIKCILHEKFIAVGEIGLDYSGTFGQHAEIQMRVFARQLGLAIETGKPMVIHCRDAEEDCFVIMTKFVPRDYKIHRHCFKGSYASAQRWLGHFPNLFIGLTPVVTYKSASDVRDLAMKMPLNRLLLETDAPYFVPSCATRSEMKFSHPGMAVTVAEEVAWLRSIPVNEVLVACRENTWKMYGI